MADDLDRAKYVSLTTFKRDGSRVASPVWVTGSGDTYLVTTGDKAWKTRRLLRNPSVEVRVCTMRGRIKANAPLYLGTAEVLTSPDVVTAAEKELAAKYGLQARAARVLLGFRARFGGDALREMVAIRLTLAATST